MWLKNIWFLTCLFMMIILVIIQIVLRNPCREGKKLLVLDIDYTLFDHRSTAENPRELMRPCKCLIRQYFPVILSLFNVYFCQLLHADLHEFLSAAYAAYDIMIWSATRWVFALRTIDNSDIFENQNMYWERGLWSICIALLILFFAAWSGLSWKWDNLVYSIIRTTKLQLCWTIWPW